MKYLRRFNEDLVNREELKDFCEMYLAYLLDDGKITIDVNDDNIIVIQNIFKRWDQIKDHFIPFIEMLDKSYNISEGSSILLHTTSGAKKFTKKQILNDIPESISNLYYIKIDLDKDKVVNESFDKESLTDLCDSCLAYLMDDGYEYEIQQFHWLDYKIIKFDNKLIENISKYWPYKKQNFFRWSDVKDQMIPFLEILSRQYRIKDVKMEIIIEWEDGGVTERCFMEAYLSKLLEDRLDDDTQIKTISISVMEKPKPKKGIIGKIKSFF